MKVERVSYDVITPSAARGILEAIHWKPAIKWVVDAIHVLKPVQFQSVRRNEVKDRASSVNARRVMNGQSSNPLYIDATQSRQQRAALILTDVSYVIEAHFVMTKHAGERDSVAKHLDIFNRRAAKGQCFQQPCMGTREFEAYFSLVPHNQPLPAAIPETRDLGFMLWDIDHASPGMPSLFFRARMVDGVIAVPPPGSGEIAR